jgi:hypothetical protein
MNFFWSFIVALALIVCSLLLFFATATAEEGTCGFGLKMKGGEYIMRMQCDQEEPKDYDRCKTHQIVLGKKDKVFTQITCCNFDGECLAVLLPTDKTKI